MHSGGLGLVLRQGFSMLSRNLLCRPSWPQTPAIHLPTVLGVVKLKVCVTNLAAGILPEEAIIFNKLLSAPKEISHSNIIN